MVFSGSAGLRPQQLRQAERFDKLRDLLAVLMCCGSQSRAPFWQQETAWRREPLYAGFPPGAGRGASFNPQPTDVLCGRFVSRKVYLTPLF